MNEIYVEQLSTVRLNMDLSVTNVNKCVIALPGVETVWN